MGNGVLLIRKVLKLFFYVMIKLSFFGMGMFGFGFRVLMGWLVWKVSCWCSLIMSILVMLEKGFIVWKRVIKLVILISLDSGFGC